MNSGLGEALLLGALQGLTEFLPVSSSGHLALAQLLFGIQEGGLTLNVMLHGGTLLATVVVLRKRLVAIVTDSWRGIRDPEYRGRSPGLQDISFVLLATLPTALFAFPLRDFVAESGGAPSVLGCGFLFTSLLLLSTLRAPSGERIAPPWWMAVAIGIAQGIAVIPGVSRSGSTIAVALWLGIRSERAFELSMLMSLPVVFGAVLLELRHVSELGYSVGVLIAGATSAFLVGLLALELVRRAVTQGRFAMFALWVFPLAIATLALGRAWPS
ncbi:MAG: undecaprenyl-diphosphate phosphatase [Polyangiaceae bacterium]|nr:undecaprenyl-diphosphate phosphatase [Polyangiaceae bacterium]